MEPNELRTQAILRDIYARHGIAEGLSPKDAHQQLLGKHKVLNELSSGFANPAERSAARTAHALKGTDQDDVKRRWEQSQYLMDPVTAAKQKRFGRDADFLATHVDLKTHEMQPPRIDRHEKAVPYPSYGQPGGSFASEVASHRAGQVAGALDRWDRSGAGAGNLHRDSWLQPNTYAAQSNAANLLKNRDGAVGAAFLANNQAYTGLQSLFGGENKGQHSNAYRDAVGEHAHGHRYRTDNPSQSPVLDLPDGATPRMRDNRLLELQALEASAMQPESPERWQRTEYWTPPPVISDLSDRTLEAIDFTTPISLLSGGTFPTILKGLATDHALDHVTTAGVMSALPPDARHVNRSPMEYIFGNGENAVIKTREQVEDAQAARQQMYDDSMTRHSQGHQQSVSESDRRAYDALMKSGAVRTPFLLQGLHRP